MGTKCSRDTLTHFDSAIKSVWLTDHITSKQRNPDTQNTFHTEGHHDDIFFMLRLQLLIILIFN